MESKWLQTASLGASGGPVGAKPASGASPEASWRDSGAARGSPQKTLFAAWGRPGAKS